MPRTWAGIPRPPESWPVREAPGAGAYVRITPDPSDSRAKIATLISAGRAALEHSLTVIAEIARQWAAALGAKRYHELRRALNEISLL